jgi:hypothetical protein
MPLCHPASSFVIPNALPLLLFRIYSLLCYTQLFLFRV